MHTGRCGATASLSTGSRRRLVDWRSTKRQAMENFAGRWCEFFLERWQTATLYEYCVACTVIVVGGWLVSRATSR
jgi:hypothetical protein